MIEIVRTSAIDNNFVELVKQLDAFLAETDGDEHSFYAQLNKVNFIKHVVVAYKDGHPAGCGAIKEYAADTMEVKRMYTLPQSRREGIALNILIELETWASEMHFKKCVLETGKRQPEAIALYEKNGYKTIPGYGKYINVENSVCFGKDLI